MLNWFVAGHEIDPDHWYYKVEEGGRVLGNMCHWTDFIYHCIEPESRYPIVINPTRAEKSDCDVAVTFTFGDGSIAAITFSAKGHTFEGVRERFSAHRGDVLISMDDFRTLTIETVASKRKVSGLHRDQGHMRSILSTYDASSGPAPTEMGLPVSYIWESGELFLKTREALDQNRKVTVFPYSQSSAARTLQQAN